MEFRSVDTVRLGGGKIVVGFLNVPSSPILVTLMKEALNWRNIPEDAILPDHSPSLVPKLRRAQLISIPSYILISLGLNSSVQG
jgi:hypothetical protein